MTDEMTAAAAVPPVEPRQPRRSEREEMLDGKLYDASDPQLAALRDKAADLCSRFNALPRGATAERAAVLDELLPSHGKALDVLGPVFFDYGCHTTIGDRVFANFNFTVLDCAPVTIGDDVLFGPNVSLLPPMHPLRWQDRNVREREDGSTYDYEYGKPIVIGSNCWFGGNVTVLGGVTIGEGCVIGAGAVVTRDIPPNSVAVGNPARVIRTITDADASVYQDYAR
ncbi:sugar O-acetyltransferase [Bifidobacterium pullorum subsp. saeculare]|uniref:Sugar O-acetyltransferase n=1 Tax=Bifidobacterium pullorum subsp. saeculare TaxID=78257 RepID=A0A939B9E6_9BIFI|nr:sugar O-acetyltransferase [Bifidobacterium pullorum]MBM6699438.1 sugar O-acetyltransferase [Bifidobacterium pullorum subsp. saeculare]